uniref:Uncharacterized protein n=1 Tax=Anguilla anguilla TaxID=7936 RepID=A0A0E9SUY1_ANGAN
MFKKMFISDFQFQNFVLFCVVFASLNLQN